MHARKGVQKFLPLNKRKSMAFGILHAQDLGGPSTAWPESMHLARFRMQCETQIQLNNEQEECSFGMLFVCAAKSTPLKDMFFGWNKGQDEHQQACCECNQVNWCQLKEQACDGVISAEELIREYHEHVL